MESLSLSDKLSPANKKKFDALTCEMKVAERKVDDISSQIKKLEKEIKALKY